jgi:hypothetical protein
MGFSSLRCLLAVLIVAAATGSALAEGSHERTQFGHDISIGPDEQASDVTCFNCSVRVHGQVTGDVTTFGGNVIIERDGSIGGDLTVFAGDLRLDSGATVKDVTVFGGSIRRDPQASIGGDVTTIAGGAALWLFVIFGLPLLVLGAFIALIIWLIRRFARPAVPVPARV